MSFTQNNVNSRVYAPAYFLGHEECVRKTYQFKQTGATTAPNGGKYVPMGTLITEGTGENTKYIGFAFEDVDVTTGDMAGSVVTKGVVIEDRLPATLTSAQKTALEAQGFTFITEPTVTRPY